MKPEIFARTILILLVAASVAAAGLLLRPGSAAHAVELVASVAETGGWTPADIQVEAGSPLNLRLTSSDVVHGFGIGQSSQPSVDVFPGEYSQLTLTFDKPGRYTYYCTRWCGPDHWRMRGIIEVTGGDAQPASGRPPLYQQLGLDLDQPSPIYPSPAVPPSALRGAEMNLQLPGKYATPAYYRSHSPWQLYQDLSAEPLGARLEPGQLWDLTAWAWQQAVDPQSAALGEKLFRENCAACHGEQGRGDGVLAGKLAAPAAETEMTHPSTSGETPATLTGHEISAPTDFTRLDQILGRSPAHLQGKIIRGGMGTGMPYWGPIFTEAQTWALVDYLWSFSLIQP